MRAKQLFSRIPVPSQIKLVYARLTLNKLTTTYFVVAVLHCVLQVVFQLAAHAINVNARHLVSQILTQARLTMDKFALVETKRRPPSRIADLTLTLCTGIPGQFGLTGKAVCNLLWSQSRGLVNDTLEDFLSPGSDDEPSESGSDSDKENKTKSGLPRSSSASITATALPVFASTSTSSSVATTATVRSSASASSTSSVFTSLRPSLSSVASTTPRPTAFSSTSVQLSSSSILATTSRPAPTPGTGNIIKPDSDSSDSHGADSPSSDDDGGKPTLGRLRIRRRKTREVPGAEKRDGERKVFDREKLRPLSLPPRAPSSPSLTEDTIDIDESYPDLNAHRRRAYISPITPALLQHYQIRDESRIEFVPIAPKRAAGPKRFIRARSKRALSTPKRRALIDSDRREVIVTPVFKPRIKKDDDKDKTGPNAVNMAKDGKPDERLVAVKLSGLVGPELGSNLATSGDVELTPGCALALSWPAQVLRDFAREDLAMIGFQGWLLVMSVVAILNESVPHLVAGLFTQTLSTGWSAFQMARSSSFRAQYEATIVRGACSGVDVLPDYFSHRTQDEIPIVVLNGIFLLTMIALSWRMCRVYGWQTFKRIGASRVMNGAYRLVLAFSIHLQLAVYFFVTSSALWVDELLNGPIACFAEHRTIYEGVFITSVLLLLPWLVLGWIGVRRENKVMMHAFLVISLLFVTAWAAMFASDVYRWTFATWPFFAAMTVVSYVVLVATTGLAIICRYNFKKGLALFLQSQQILPSGEFSDALPPAANPFNDPEKIEFPTHQELPTFSVAFGQGGQPVAPSQMMFSSVAAPAAALTRGGSARSTLVRGGGSTRGRQAQEETLSSGYSVNPYANGSAHFWGDDVSSTTTTTTTSKSNTDASVHDTFRTAEASDIDVPKYSLEDDHPRAVQQQRELPQWQEVRRSELPSDFTYPQMHTPAPLPPPPPSLQPTQPDNASTYTATATGNFEVLRNGRWVQVDAHELYGGGTGTGTHTSGISGAASWAPGDDVAPLPTTRPPMPMPVPAARGFVGLPGKNVKPQKNALGGQAVPNGW
ncbi:hypothetical protein FRC12_003877 [Ceratobasidium sp. 428]|nr:hypothetical protein FRC12_003877 [Ceratobasidium sp. 428]